MQYTFVRFVAGFQRMVHQGTRQVMDNPFPVVFLLGYALISAYALRSGMFSFATTLWLAAIFFALPPRSMMLGGIVAYLVGIVFYTGGADYRLFLFALSYVFIIAAFLRYIVMFFTNPTVLLPSREEWVVFPVVPFWIGESGQIILTFVFALVSAQQDAKEQREAFERLQGEQGQEGGRDGTMEHYQDMGAGGRLAQVQAGLRKQLRERVLPFAEKGRERLRNTVHSFASGVNGREGGEASATSHQGLSPGQGGQVTDIVPMYVRPQAETLARAEEVPLHRKGARPMRADFSDRVAASTSFSGRSARGNGEFAAFPGGGRALPQVEGQVQAPQFFNPPPEEPLSRQFLLISLMLFLLVNGVVFWQRHTLVSALSLLFGGEVQQEVQRTRKEPQQDKSVATELPSLEGSSLEEDFATLDFREDSLTPIFGTGGEREEVFSGTEVPTSIAQGVPTVDEQEVASPGAAATATEPPLPTEPPLSVESDKRLLVYLFNASGVESEGRTVESLLEQHNCYVGSIQDAGAVLSETTVSYKSGQKAYAERVKAVLEDRYTVVLKQSLPNDYRADVQITIGSAS